MDGPSHWDLVFQVIDSVLMMCLRYLKQRMLFHVHSLLRIIGFPVILVCRLRKHRSESGDHSCDQWIDVVSLRVLWTLCTLFMQFFILDLSSFIHGAYVGR